MANVSIQSHEPPVELLPSHIAAVKNDVEKLSSLVKENAPLVDPSTNETPLHAAAKTGSIEALKWLVKNRTVKLDSKSTTGNTAAHLAAVYGHLSCLKLILTFNQMQGKKLAAVGEDGGLTVLSLATLQGDKEMFSWLLESFPETAHIPNSNGDQVIHFAAAEGHLDFIKQLVDKFGTEIVSRKDNRFTSPVFFAAQQGELGILDYLINELGQDAVGKDRAGLTTVHAATQSERIDTVKWLINKLGPKYILEKTTDGATPLHMAAASGNTEILKFLLDNLTDKKDVNITDNINATPAHDAAEYGQIKTMLLLLKHGADVKIADTENKTPYDLALEKDYNSVAAMVADYRDNGPSALQLYEKRRAHPPNDGKARPRTTRQVAEELSTAIEQTTETQNLYKEKQLRRQESLDELNEVKRSPQKTDEDDDIEHELGPKGDIYAMPNRKGFGRSRVRSPRSRQTNDLDDFVNETAMSHKYNPGGRGHPPKDDEDPHYASINHETASNYSRPSRVKHYPRDSDSEISGLTGRSDYLYDGQSPGFYPPGYNPMYPTSLPPQVQRGKRVKRPGSASSRGSHMSGSQYNRGMGMSPHQFHPVMVYSPPLYHQGYVPQAGGGLMAIPHQQHGAMTGFTPQQGGRPMYMAPRMMQMQQYHQQQQQVSRRKSLIDKKKMKKLASEGKPSPRKIGTDRGIGYGPGPDISGSTAAQLPASKVDDTFHPPAPPITAHGGRMEAGNDVLKFDSNFLMARPGEANEVRHHAGTALNPAKQQPRPYDGRYDKYIMPDSEDEYEVDEFHRVGFAAEMACILAIGCVAGLKGLSRMRRGKPEVELPSKTSKSSDKPSLSTAWDVSYTGTEQPAKKKKGKKSRRSSITEQEAALIKENISPELFAGREELGEKVWDKSKQKKQKKGNEEEVRKSVDPEEPQSELLTAELQKQSYRSVSKALGEKILYDTIGARHSSMINIASSGLGSRMSLASSADEDNDDDFGDAISIVHGITNPTKKRRQSDPVSVDEDETKQLLPEGKEKHKKKRKKDKEGKDKERKERKPKKERKSKRESSEEDAEIIENREATTAITAHSVSSAVSGAAVETDIAAGQEIKSAEEADVRESEEKKEKEREKKEKELREKEKKEKKEAEKREKEQRDKEKREAGRREKEQRDKEKKEAEKEKEQRDKEKKEADKKVKEQRDKEKKEADKKVKEQRDKEKREKDAKDKEQKEKDKKEKEARDKERKEREKKEKEERKEREAREKEQRDIEKRNKAAAEKERKEREREQREKKEQEKREKKEEARKSATPARSAPPPPTSHDSGAESSDETNANEKKGGLKKSKDKQKKSQTAAEAPSTTSQAKPASKDTPPTRSLAMMRPAEPVTAPGDSSPSHEVELEAEFDDEPREVENKLYMFDTESEEEEEEEEDVPDVRLARPRARKTPVDVDPNVAKIEANMRNMFSDLNSNGFLEAPAQNTTAPVSSAPAPAPASAPALAPGKMYREVPKDVGISTDQTKTTRVGGQMYVGESREEQGMGHVMMEDEMGMQYDDNFSAHEAMAEEMRRFYEEEDLYTYEEGSTPSMDKDSYDGIPGEDENGKILLVTRDRLEQSLAKSNVSNIYQAPQGTQGTSGVGRSTGGAAVKMSVHSVGVGGGIRMSEAGVQSSNRTSMHSIETQATQSGVGRSKGGGAVKMSVHSVGVGGGIEMSEAGVQSSNRTSMHSIGTQESVRYSSSFEQNILATLQGLNDKMAQMKANPAVTQNEINQQEQLQHQMIQSMINVSLNDPEVTKNLLAMTKQQAQQEEASRSRSRRESTAFQELESKLLLAQEQQRQETRKHFKNQEEFQEYMRNLMEEQSKSQMVGMEKYSLKMQEQLAVQFAEQQRKWEAEMRKRMEEDLQSEKRRKKESQKAKPAAYSSDSSSTDSDEELVLVPAPASKKLPKYPSKAKILKQTLLQDQDDMKVESTVSISKMQEKQRSRGKLARMNTSVNFDNASQALQRYESSSSNVVRFNDIEASSDEDNIGEMMHTQKIAPVTLKRAEIKTQSGTGFTPIRPKETTFVAPRRVGQIRRIESGSDMEQQQKEHEPSEGAGNELQRALQRRRGDRK